MCENLLLAIDSGGSKSDYLLVDPERRVIARARGKGFAALNPGTLPVERYLREGLSGVVAWLDRIVLVYCSLGGPNTEEVTATLKAILPKAEICIGREADGDMILSAALAYRAKAAVLCGTGSVAVGEIGNVRVYAGGWGPYLGDGGSGGGLGYDALKLLLRAVDSGRGTAVLPGIFPGLARQAGTFSERMALKMAANRISRAEMAAEVPRIADLAVSGDPDALHLLNKAAEEVVFLAESVTPEKAEPNADSILAMGGLFNCGKLFRDLCVIGLGKKRRGFHFIFDALTMIDAAADFAVKIYDNKQRRKRGRQ